MIKNKIKGNIINVSSQAGRRGEALVPHYCASKAAVISLTKILAKELAPMGITVNAIGPTPIKTDLIRAVPDDKIKKLIQNQAIKRYGEFEDILNVIQFFVNPKSDFITGQVIFLGGI